jgi:FkbM family methyltransferase
MKITAEGWAIVERDTHMGKWVEEHRRLDFDQNALPQMLPYIKPGGVAIDAGANIGCYAAGFIKVASRVICFEPNPEAYECLLHNSKLIPGIDTYPYALSDKPAGYKLVSENDNIGMAFLKPDTNGDKATTIDNMDLHDCVFIKIDVEGYELHVLKGAKKTISYFKPVLVIEINDHTLRRTGIDRKEIFQWLTDHGYTYRNIYAEQGLQDDQLDIICFPS